MNYKEIFTNKNRMISNSIFFSIQCIMGGKSSKPKETAAAKARRRQQDAVDKTARQARLRRAFAGPTNTFAEQKRDEIRDYRQFSLAMAGRHPVRPPVAPTAPRRPVKSAMKTGSGGRRTRRKRHRRRHTKRHRRRHTKRRRRRHRRRRTNRRRR